MVTQITTKVLPNYELNRIPSLELSELLGP